MIQLFFKTAFRQLLKHRYYSILTIIGLGLAIACGLFIYIYNSYQLRYDQFHHQKDRTYMVVYDLKLEQVEHEKGGSFAMYEAISKEMPQIEKTALYIDKKDFTIEIEDKQFKTDGKAAFASSNYFNMLDFPWKQGNPKDLDAPNTVALTASTAKLYFGDENAIGKTILVEGEFTIKVIGIIDDSRKNSDFRSEVYFSLKSIPTLFKIDTKDDYFHNWGYTNTNNNILLTLRNNEDKVQVEKTIHELVGKYYDKSVLEYYSYKLLPLTDFHFDKDYGKGTQKSLLQILSIIALGISIMAIVNYSNILFAQQMNRSVEMGVRKILGSSKKQLFYQFLLETLILTFLSTIFALILLSIFLNWSNGYLFQDEPIAIVSFSSLISIVGLTWICTALLTSVYPLLFVNRTPIQDALKKLTMGPWSFTRKSFIILQNVIAMVLLIATLVIILQVHYLKNTDLGFEREQVFLFPMKKEMFASKEKIKHFLAKRPDITSFSFCDNPPANDKVWGGTIQFDDRSDWEKWPARYAIADSSYIKTFNIKLVAGHNFNDNPKNPEFLINQKMARDLGYENPYDILGKSLNAGGLNEESIGKIVGVVADFSTNSLKEGIAPTVIGYNAGRLKNIAIKFNGTNPQQFIHEFEQQWRDWYPKEIFEYKFYDEQIANLYAKETLTEKLIWIAAVVSVIISTMGFLGLLSITILKRTKEIGIRKVLGSSIAGIIQLLTQDFVKWMIISGIIATPIAFYLMNRWLEDFPFRIELTWWIFASALLFGVMITLLVISFQSFKAARANPVDSLRDE